MKLQLRLGVNAASRNAFFATGDFTSTTSRPKGDAAARQLFPVEAGASTYDGADDLTAPSR
jgi:hypothetical protein